MRISPGVPTDGRLIKCDGQRRVIADAGLSVGRGRADDGHGRRVDGQGRTRTGHDARRVADGHGIISHVRGGNRGDDKIGR